MVRNLFHKTIEVAVCDKDGKKVTTGWAYLLFLFNYRKNKTSHQFGYQNFQYDSITARVGTVTYHSQCGLPRQGRKPGTAGGEVESEI